MEKTDYRAHFRETNLADVISKFESISIKDAQKFYDRFYHPSRQILMVSGDIDADSVEQRIHEELDYEAPKLADDSKVPSLSLVREDYSLDAPQDVSAVGIYFGLRDRKGERKRLATSALFRSIFNDKQVQIFSSPRIAEKALIFEPDHAPIRTGVRLSARPQDIEQAVMDFALQLGKLQASLSEETFATAKHKFGDELTSSLAALSNGDIRFSAISEPEQLLEEVERLSFADFKRQLSRLLDPSRATIGIVADSRTAPRPDDIRMWLAHPKRASVGHRSSDLLGSRIQMASTDMAQNELPVQPVETVEKDGRRTVSVVLRPPRLRVGGTARRCCRA